MKMQLELLRMSVNRKGKVEKKDVEKLEKLTEKFKKTIAEMEGKGRFNHGVNPKVMEAINEFNRMQNSIKTLRQMVESEEKG